MGLWHEMPLPGFRGTKKIAEIIGENSQMDAPLRGSHSTGEREAPIALFLALLKSSFISIRLFSAADWRMTPSLPQRGKQPKGKSP